MRDLILDLLKNNKSMNVYDKVILPNIFSKIKNNQSLSQDEYKPKFK